MFVEGVGHRTAPAALRRFSERDVQDLMVTMAQPPHFKGFAVVVVVRFNAAAAINAYLTWARNEPSRAHLSPGHVTGSLLLTINDSQPTNRDRLTMSRI